MDIETLKNLALDYANDVFERDGYIRMICALHVKNHPETGESTDGIVFVLPDGTRDKDHYVELIHDVARKTDAVGAAFISEAWITSVSLTGERETKKTECVLITVETRQHRMGTTLEIDRSGEKPQLKPFSDWATQNEGRFARLLPAHDLSTN